MGMGIARLAISLGLSLNADTVYVPRAAVLAS
jgi:hypothetical protein